MTPEKRDEFRKLRDASISAEKAFSAFKSDFEARNKPETRRYAPFEKVTMTILDQPQPTTEGSTYVYFVKELE
jgi:hypothetical protein